MLVVIVRRILSKALVRGLVCMTAVGSGETPVIDLRGKLGCGEWKQRPVEAIDGIVIHHTASAYSATPQSLADFHMLSRGWACIGYHFTVDKSGQAQWCNDIEDKTWHVACCNTRKVAISLIGNYDVNVPSAEMDRAVRYLVMTLRSKYGPLPVEYHLDLGSTACPGRYTVKAFDDLHNP
jgi:hypothetical protein